MIRVILHLLVLPFMFWFGRRHGTGTRPLKSAFIWYLLGVPLMLVEVLASYDSGRLALFLQSLLVAAFFLPPAYFAFRYADKSRGVIRPLMLFVLLSVIAGLVAGLVLARAPFVSGFMW